MGFGHFFHWFPHLPFQFIFCIPVVFFSPLLLSLAFWVSLFSFLFPFDFFFFCNSEGFWIRTIAGPLVRGGEGSLFLSSFCCGNGSYRQSGRSCPLSPHFPPLPSLLFLSSCFSLSLSLSLTFHLPWPKGAQPVVCFSTHSAWHVHVWWLARLLLASIYFPPSSLQTTNNI